MIKQVPYFKLIKSHLYQHTYAHFLKIVKNTNVFLVQLASKKPFKVGVGCIVLFSSIWSTDSNCSAYLKIEKKDYFPRIIYIHAKFLSCLSHFYHCAKKSLYLNNSLLIINFQVAHECASIKSISILAQLYNISQILKSQARLPLSLSTHMQSKVIAEIIVHNIDKGKIFTAFTS